MNNAYSPDVEVGALSGADSIDRLKLHPLCELFPKLEQVEFEQLCEDLYANGQRELIITFQGQILDGRNRYEACLNIGKVPAFKEYEGGDPLAFVMSANLHRRHLTAGQQAAIVAMAQDWDKAQKTGGNGSNQFKNEQRCNVAPLQTAKGRAAHRRPWLKSRRGQVKCSIDYSFFVFKSEDFSRSRISEGTDSRW